MNRQLAIVFAWAIEWVAILIIIGGAAAGHAAAIENPALISALFKNMKPADIPTVGAWIGGFGGFCIAVIICGPLAMIAQIEKHLRTMQPDADKTERHLAEIKADLARAITDAKEARDREL